MKTYIALLRGINVSGQKKILMADLRKLMEELHFKNVKTYIQSGNIIFDTSNTTIEFLENQICEKIKIHFGFDVVTFIKSPEEIELAIKNNPFLIKNSTEHKKYYAIFLSEKPSITITNHLNSNDYSPDEFIIKDKLIYFYAANGAGNSKLSTNFFESKLKVKATARNWNTINKLLELSKKN